MKNPDNRHRLLSRVSLYSKFFWIGSVSAVSTIALYAIISLIAYVKHGKYVHMLPAIYPYIGKPTGFTHWFLYGFELIACSFIFAVTAGVVCGFGMYSIQMCGELRVLAGKFESLKASSDYKANIKDCIERHQMLYNCKRKLENLFGTIAIWFAITASIILCSLIFQLTQVSESNMNYILYISQINCLIEISFRY